MKPNCAECVYVTGLNGSFPLRCQNPKFMEFDRVEGPSTPRCRDVVDKCDELGEFHPKANDRSEEKSLLRKLVGWFV